MKIARVEALHCDGGWRPWTFVRIETDTGLIGWGECSDNRSPHGIAGSVRDMADLLIARKVQQDFLGCLQEDDRVSAAIGHEHGNPARHAA